MSSNLEQIIADNTAVLAEVKKLLESSNRPNINDIEESAKNHIIDFMMEHMNIPFIEDDTEKKIYDAILNIVFKVVSGYI